MPSPRHRAAVAMIMATIALPLAGCAPATEGSPEAAERVPAAQKPEFSPVAGASPGTAVAESRVNSRTPASVAAQPRRRWKTARLTRRTTLRTSPGGRAVARLETKTEFGSPRVLGVTGRRGGWMRVIATELPNGRRGWIRAAHADVGRTGWSVHVDRSARRLVLRHDGRRVRSFRVAVGRAATPTPVGRYAVTDKLTTGRSDSPYGCCIVALSGHQTRLVEGWPGGDRLAIHATPQPETIGRAASLGCMRAHTGDVRALMRRVPLGAPVFVRR